MIQQSLLPFPHTQSLALKPNISKETDFKRFNTAATMYSLTLGRKVVGPGLPIGALSVVLGVYCRCQDRASREPSKSGHLELFHHFSAASHAPGQASSAHRFAAEAEIPFWHSPWHIPTVCNVLNVYSGLASQLGITWRVLTDYMKHDLP